MDDTVLNNHVLNNLSKVYVGKSFLEAVALCLGRAQILEIGLKQFVLCDKIGVPEKEVEKLTLGQLISKMRKEGIHEQYVDFLDEHVREGRNGLAHSILANWAILDNFDVGFSEHMKFKDIRAICYSMEMALILFDEINKNDGWVVK